MRRQAHIYRAPANDTLCKLGYWRFVVSVARPEQVSAQVTRVTLLSETPVGAEDALDAELSRTPWMRTSRIWRAADGEHWRVDLETVD